MDVNNFRFGIEHEIAFINSNGEFADFSNTLFSDLQKIVDVLPEYGADADQLRTGDAGIKRKRWYIEGFERFDLDGTVIDCPPKGIEIRTSIHNSVLGAVNELSQSIDMIRAEATKLGFAPIIASFNPNSSEFVPNPPLNSYEQSLRKESPESRTAAIPMLTYGPDLSISNATFSTAENIDIARKFTYYSPFIVPFSFSSPIVNGKVSEFLSYRTYVRTGIRPATMVFIKNTEDYVHCEPSLTQIARIPAETGRIEFKAFDTCADFSLYSGLLALLKALAIDKTLEGRSDTPNSNLHKLSAKEGFKSEIIFETAKRVLDTASNTLSNASEAVLITPLRTMLQARRSPAFDIVSRFQPQENVSRNLGKLIY
ncbi:MAG: glutamate-cysteine ligase family protein [Pyrinomonadaceae bacterium]